MDHIVNRKNLFYYLPRGQVLFIAWHHVVGLSVCAKSFRSCRPLVNWCKLLNLYNVYTIPKVGYLVCHTVQISLSSCVAPTKINQFKGKLGQRCRGNAGSKYLKIIHLFVKDSSRATWGKNMSAQQTVVRSREQNETVADHVSWQQLKFRRSKDTEQDKCGTFTQATSKVQA